MPTFPTIQTSFAAGELAPYLWGRVDLAKFHVGARTMLNWFAHAHGGASTRPGTRFIGEVDDSDDRHRLIPFEFRTLPAGQTYMLVFGELTMQVAMFNGTSWGFVESSPGVRFTLATPYAATDLALLKFVQSADTMTLTHTSYSARKLTRTGHAAWTLTPVSFAPSTVPPTGLAAGSSGSAGYIEVTAINDSTGEESLPTAAVGATSNTAGVWTWNPVAGCTNYNVYKKKGSVFGFVAQVQTATWTDASIDPDISNTPPGSRTPFGTNILTSLTISSPGSGYSAPTGQVIDGGRVITTVTFGLTAGAITSAVLADVDKQASSNAYVQITDGTGAGAALAPVGSGHLDSILVVAPGTGYSSNTQITMLVGAVVNPFGYSFTVHVDGGGAITSVDVSGGTDYDPGYDSMIQFVVTDSVGSGAVLTPNVTGQPDTGPNNPGCSTYIMQRQAFGNTTAFPQTLWFTVVGAFGNMNVSTPTRDSDAITRSLTGRQVNEIRHLVPVGSNMLVMTSGAEWRCWPGPASNALTPAACFTLPQTAHGSSHVPPIQAGNDVLFVQEKGSRVRALRFDAIQDQYQSFDMSILASHLLYDFAGAHRIVEWAYAAEPFQIIWSVRDDGVLLGFTYMREQEVYAWHRHTTDGTFESVATITEPDGFGGYEDAVYLIVNRTIGGATKRYLERMVSRTCPTIADAWFLDCALQYSGSPVSTFSGLDHLEGETVAILADGSVVPSQVVSGGEIVLDGSYSKVTAGLPYTCDLETLNLELPGGGTIQGQMKKIAQVTVRVKDSRGLKVGINTQNVNGTATPYLAEVKQQWKTALGTALPLYTGDWAVESPSEWNRDGRLLLRQDYPLPATILDVIPEVNRGD